MIRATVRSLTAALAGLIALAAAPSAGRGALLFDFSLGARVMYTDNLHLDPEPQLEGQPEPVRETVYAAIPALRLEWEAGGDRLFMDSRGEYWTFTGDEDLDPIWLPDLTAELEWRRWAPFFLESEAVRERVPSSQDREGETILDQADRTMLTVFTGLAWERGANRRVEIGYRGELEDFSEGSARENDRVTRQFGEGLVRHQWSPLWWTEVSAHYGRVTQDLAADYHELGVAGSIEYLLSERLTATGRLEWLRETYDAIVDRDQGNVIPASERTSTLKSADIRQTLERGGFLLLRYQDRLESQPNGDTLELGRASAEGLLRARLGSEFGAEIWRETREFRVSGRDETDWGPTLLARWMIAPSFALDLGGSWTDATIREREAEDVEDRTTCGAAALVFLMGRHLLAETGFSYRKNDSTEEARSYTASLFYAGLTYHFGSIPPGVLPASKVGRLVSPDESPVGGR